MATIVGRLKAEHAMAAIAEVPDALELLARSTAELSYSLSSCASCTSSLFMLLTCDGPRIPDHAPAADGVLCKAAAIAVGQVL